MLYPNIPLALFNMGAWEIAVILLVVLLLFGGKKMPELARGLARGIRVFRDELKGVKDDLEADDQAKPPASPPKQEQAASTERSNQG